MASHPGFVGCSAQVKIHTLSLILIDGDQAFKENILKNPKQVIEHSSFTSHQCYYPRRSIKRHRSR